MVLSLVLVLAVVVVPTVDAAPRVGADGRLYLLQTQGGSLRGKKLVLHGVEPRATSFTDRPQRSAGSLTTGRLASSWGTIFGAVAPNAALEVQGAPAGRDVALLELRRPRYDARTHTLTFSVRRLRHTGDPALAEFDRRADGDAVKRFGPASLFVDSGGGPTVSVEAEVFVPAGKTLAVEFEGGMSQSNGTYISGIQTPPANLGTSTGTMSLQGSTMSFTATLGGGGMRAQVLVFVSESEGKISGEASIPAEGGEVSISVSNKPFKKIADGKFSIPSQP
jgi:hypothetical protein